MHPGQPIEHKLSDVDTLNLSASPSTTLPQGLSTRPLSKAESRTPFLFVFLAWLLTLTCAYLLVVSLVDPRQRFVGSVFPEIIANTRALKLRLFRSYAKPGQSTALILGSSRSMALSPALLGSIVKKNYFNFGVYGGSPEDFLAIYRTVRLHGHALEEILIALDLAALRSSPYHEELLANPVLLAGLQGAHPGATDYVAHWFKQYKETLSIPYALDIAHSIKVFLQRRKPNSLFSVDGGEAFARWEDDLRSGEYHPEANFRRCELGAVNTFRDLQQSSSDRLQWLQTLFQEARRDGTRVRVLITPYHPTTLAAIAQQPQARDNFRRVAATVAAISAEASIPFADFSDISAFQGQGSNWFDCSHYSSQDADRLIRGAAGRLF